MRKSVRYQLHLYLSPKLFFFFWRCFIFNWMGMTYAVSECWQCSLRHVFETLSFLLKEIFFSLCMNYQTRHPQANFKWKENCNLTVFQFNDLHLPFAWKRFLVARQVTHLIWPQSGRWWNKMLCSYFYFCTFSRWHTTCRHACTYK